MYKAVITVEFELTDETLTSEEELEMIKSEWTDLLTDYRSNVTSIKFEKEGQ